MANLYNVDSPINREERNNLNLTFQDIQSEIGKVVLKTQSVKDEVEGSLGGLQSQIDTLVVDGDSSPEAAQARVGYDGEIYGTLKERIDGEVSTLFDEYGVLSKNFADPKSFGAVGDGLTDDTLAFTEAINYINEGGKLKPSPGQYYVDNLVITKDIEVDFTGVKINSGANGIKFQGSLKSEKTVTENYNPETSKNTLTLNNTSGIEVGDIINIVSSELFDLTRLYYYKGCNALVTKIEGNKVHFSLTMPFSMSASSIVVKIYKPISAKVTGGLIYGYGNLSDSTNGLSFEYCKDVLIEKTNTDNFKTNILISRCVNTTINNVQTGRAKSIGDTFDGYGVSVYSSTNTVFNEVVTKSGQHGITNGGREVCFGLTINNSNLQAETTSLSFGAHSNIYDVFINGSTLYGMSLFGNVTVRDCIVYNSTTQTNNISLLMSHDEKFANYTFENTIFDNSTILNYETYQVLSPETKKIGNIKFFNCKNFQAVSSVTSQTSGSKVGEINNLTIENCSDFKFTARDKHKTVNIINSSSTMTGNVISNLSVSNVFQVIDELNLKNVKLPKRYRVISLNDVVNLSLENVSYISSITGDDSILLNNITNLSLNNLDLTLSDGRGIEATSTIQNLSINNSKITSSSGGLNTIFLNATTLSGKNNLERGNDSPADYNTSPALNKYKTRINDSGALVNSLIQ